MNESIKHKTYLMIFLSFTVIVSGIIYPNVFSTFQFLAISVNLILQSQILKELRNKND